MWIAFAFGSAVFAGLTAILAKCGIKNIAGLCEQIARSLELEKEEQDLAWFTGLLHDVGRFVQYEDGTPHQLASLPLAEKLMVRHGYTEEEKARILRAIENHRNREIRDEKSLTGILYRADKMSRSCFGCKAEKECDWSAEKKNLIIEY